MLEAGLLDRTGAKDLPQLIEPDFFADVELDENEDRAAQRRLNLDSSRRVGLGWVKEDFGV